MNSQNINLLQRIYSVYLKIHLFVFIYWYACVTLVYNTVFSALFNNKKTKKTSIEKHDIDFRPNRGHIQILQNSTFTLCTVPDNLFKMLPLVLNLLAQIHIILIHPKIPRDLLSATNGLF